MTVKAGFISTAVFPAMEHTPEDRGRLADPTTGHTGIIIAMVIGDGEVQQNGVNCGHERGGTPGRAEA
jgi:hypothetical protein